MADYQSTYKGSVIDQTISTVINGQAGIQGVSVNGTELTPDSNNKVSFNIPNVLQTTGSSTTDVMSQNSVTVALGTKVNTSDLSTVATSGSYNDLSNKPTIPTIYTYSIKLLASAWVGNSPPYTQSRVEHAYPEDIMFANIVLSDVTSTAIQENAQWGFISKIENTSDALIVTCFEFKPDIDLNISLVVFRR